MERLIKQLTLNNSLQVSFIDKTIRYFGDYFVVKLETVCAVPLKDEYFSSETEKATATRILGNPVIYRKRTEKMGVPSTEIDRVLDRLITQFVDHSLSYFAQESFPHRFIQTELARKMKKNTTEIGFPR